MRDLITKLTTGFILVFITILTVLYSEGWRVNHITNLTQHNSSNPSLVKTGMLAVRSIPEAAKVFLDNEPETATDDTITSLTPGQYKLRIEKDGYEPWEKEVEVFPELVTDITAVLILQSPKLEPLTNVDVKAFTISNTQNNIAFLSKNTAKPGIWILPLNKSSINFFSNESYLLMPDTAAATPSLGESLSWSPNDKEMLVKMNEKGYLLYQTTDLNSPNTTAQSINDITTTNDKWNQYWETNFLENKLPVLVSQNISDEFIANIQSTKGNWSPDGEKFFMAMPNKENSAATKLMVYNSETPLPVGEKRVYETLSNIDLNSTNLYWYSDSYHLIMVEKDKARPNYYVISLIRIDGSNKTVIYTGNLASNQAYPTPGGDKIIVLTSLKENTPTNLYSISIR